MDIISTDGRNVVLYHYIPSGDAAWAFVSLFGLGVVIHFVYMLPLRTWCFIPFTIGCICETFGYYGRAWSHESPTNFKAFVLQSLLILIAPPLLAATIYMTLSRVIRALDAESYSLIRTRWLTTLFVFADVICFLTQLGGAGIKITGDPQIMKIGGQLVLGGLVLQIIVFAWFIMVALKFHLRLNKKPTMFSSDPGLSLWQWNMWAMYIASLAVLVRNLVRVVEYAQGIDGFIMKHEAMLYIFDAFLMFLVVFVFILVHPGRFLRKAYRAKKTFSRSSMVQLVDIDNLAPHENDAAGKRQEGRIQRMGNLDNE